MPAGRADLQCGTSGYGYRHISREHRTQWEQKAALTRQNWREVADYGIEWAFFDPTRTVYRSSNDTWCYQRFLYLVNRSTGQTVGSMTVAAVVGRTNLRVITSFPGPC